MNNIDKLLIIGALLLPSMATMATDATWDSCAAGVEAYLRAKGRCSRASICYDDKGQSLLQLSIAECGWPTFSEEERNRIIDEAVQLCRYITRDVPHQSIECPLDVDTHRNLLSLFKSSDRIHQQIIDKMMIKADTIDATWDSCAANVRTHMQTMGWCGASNCYDDKGQSHVERSIVECGWRTFTKEEKNRIIDEAVELCTFRSTMSYIPRQSVDCPMAVEYNLSLFKGSDRIHRQIMDEMRVKADKLQDQPRSKK